VTVGTQAAVLAGLDITMFIEFQPPHDSEWGDQHHISRTIKFVYYVTITMAFCANLLVVGQSTALSVLGSSMALRGPDGSMISATDGMYDERRSVFAAFGVGLVTTVLSVISAVWLILSPEAAVVCVGITLFTCMKMHRSWLRIRRMFRFDESETVDFTDIFESSAIMGISSRGSARRLLGGSRGGGGGGGGGRSGSSGGVRAVQSRESTGLATDDSLSSEEYDDLIPKSSHSNRSSRRDGGGGLPPRSGRTRRRRQSGLDRAASSGDYDIEMGSKNMRTV